MLLGAIEKLEPRRRFVFESRVFSQKTHEEIGRLLRVSKGRSWLLFLDACIKLGRSISKHAFPLVLEYRDVNDDWNIVENVSDYARLIRNRAYFNR